LIFVFDFYCFSIYKIKVSWGGGLSVSSQTKVLLGLLAGWLGGWLGGWVAGGDR
jgi:hypothetical protein